MSWNPAIEPLCPEAGTLASIETVIIPRARDLGGFEVRRALPSAKRQMVGPFIFFDQMGPIEFLTGKGIDVRPHPHIGLSTVTYLFDGEFQHRDSLGTDQMIYPGEVNWMTAGNGVTHSERTSEATRKGKAASLAFKPGSPCRKKKKRWMQNLNILVKASSRILKEKARQLTLYWGLHGVRKIQSARTLKCFMQMQYCSPDRRSRCRTIMKIGVFMWSMDLWKLLVRPLKGAKWRSSAPVMRFPYRLESRARGLCCLAARH